MGPVENNLPPFQSTSAAENGQPTKSVSTSWIDTIKARTARDLRERPWKISFGTPKGTLSDEDWINYPAMFDMAKKGIKG
jgi:hypothetical protein